MFWNQSQPGGLSQTEGIRPFADSTNIEPVAAMTLTAPHFLLFSEAQAAARSKRAGERPNWRFVLEAIDGSDRLEAADHEPSLAGQRLELLAVIRGLEALEQPSRVTLVTPSRYVVHGLRFGLPQWKENDWQWERFGELTEIKNKDLWQRLDQALAIHEVDCRTFEPASTDLDADQPYETHSPAAAHSEEKISPAAAAKTLPPTVRTRQRKRKLRVDRPHAGPRSSAPKGWWGGIFRWMRRTVNSG